MIGLGGHVLILPSQIIADTTPPPSLFVMRGSRGMMHRRRKFAAPNFGGTMMTDNAEDPENPLYRTTEGEGMGTTFHRTLAWYIAEAARIEALWECIFARADTDTDKPIDEW